MRFKSRPHQKGRVSWSREELCSAIPEFLKLYEQRPVRDNEGGMKAPHLFYTWFAARKLNPEVIVESGVWRGVGTWLLENACPEAKMYSIDPAPEHRQYSSDRAEYFTSDFGQQDWSELPKERTLLFFDDHQNALQRLLQARKLGFRHLLFEDNYPPGKGDCFSIKQALELPLWEKFHYTLAELKRNLRNGNSSAAGKDDRFTDSQRFGLWEVFRLHRLLEVYYEFPPVIQSARTRWGDRWDTARYPTGPPLFHTDSEHVPDVFRKEARYYTWFCYVRLHS